MHGIVPRMTDIHDTVENTVREVLESLGVAVRGINRSEIAGQNIFSIDTPEDARVLIGPHGDTIHALDMLVKKIL
jgi:predicted RNA-binding protein Jag